MHGARGVAATLATSVVASCAAPSRTLPLRAVEAPIVLPRRMASVAVAPFVGRSQPAGGFYSGLTPGFRLGVTDRLEWTDLLSLRYAFLDDAPESPLAHAPISLAVQAGARGFGFSSTDGFIVLPLLSVQALKHVGDRWALSLAAGWFAGWAERRTATSTPYDDRLVLTSNRWSEVELVGRATRQLTERIAVGAGGTLGQMQDCVWTFCGWRTREGSGGLHLLVRPWRWLTVGVFPSVGGRYRPEILTPPPNPTGPVAIPPRVVHWVGATGQVAFFW